MVLTSFTTNYPPVVSFSAKTHLWEKLTDYVKNPDQKVKHTVLKEPLRYGRCRYHLNNPVKIDGKQYKVRFKKSNKGVWIGEYQVPTSAPKTWHTLCIFNNVKEFLDLVDTEHAKPYTPQTP